MFIFIFNFVLLVFTFIATAQRLLFVVLCSVIVAKQQLRIVQQQ